MDRLKTHDSSGSTALRFTYIIVLDLKILGYFLTCTSKFPNIYNKHPQQTIESINKPSKNPAPPFFTHYFPGCLKSRQLSEPVGSLALWKPAVPRSLCPESSRAHRSRSSTSGTTFCTSTLPQNEHRPKPKRKIVLDFFRGYMVIILRSEVDLYGNSR